MAYWYEAEDNYPKEKCNGKTQGEISRHSLEPEKGTSHWKLWSASLLA